MFRRLLAFLLILLLPVQFSWAAAASYCGHEAEAQAKRHYGHHEHQHKADSGKPADPGKLDLDCNFCQAAGHVGVLDVSLAGPRLVGVQRVAAPPATTPDSAPQRVPDRPPSLRPA